MICPSACDHLDLNSGIMISSNLHRRNSVSMLSINRLIFNLMTAFFNFTNCMLNHMSNSDIIIWFQSLLHLPGCPECLHYFLDLKQKVCISSRATTLQSRLQHYQNNQKILKLAIIYRVLLHLADLVREENSVNYSVAKRLLELQRSRHRY